MTNNLIYIFHLLIFIQNYEWIIINLRVIPIKFIYYSSYWIFKLLQINTLLLVFNQHPSNSILTRSSSTDFMKTAIQPFPFFVAFVASFEINPISWMKNKICQESIILCQISLNFNSIFISLILYSPSLKTPDIMTF